MGKRKSVLYQVPSEQVLTYVVHPSPGGCFSAKSFGRQLEAIGELLEVCTKEDAAGRKFTAMIRSLATNSDGSHKVEILLLELDEAPQ